VCAVLSQEYANYSHHPGMHAFRVNGIGFSSLDSNQPRCVELAMSMRLPAGILRQVALTFDDGPDLATTPELLERLAELRVKVTFFVLGSKIAKPEGRALVEKIAAEGHQIGNHGFSHVDFTKLTPAALEHEIKRTEELIGTLDRGIKLLRPPFGFHNAIVDNVISKLGYRLVLWNVSSLDWTGEYQNGSWVSHTMKQIALTQNCVVLAHDVFPSTVAHVPQLVTAIRGLSNTEFAQLP
jgi:peptidoglycan-N-acetylglucosamine deacetylase